MIGAAITYIIAVPIIWFLLMTIVSSERPLDGKGRGRALLLAIAWPLLPIILFGLSVRRRRGG